MPAPVPAVEIADEADAPRVRRPDREMHALHAVHRHHVRAEFFPQPQVIALVEQMQVQFAEHGPERIRVARHALPAAEIRDPQFIPEQLRPARHEDFEQAVFMDARHGPLGARAIQFDHRDLLRVAQEHPHRHVLLALPG